LLFGSLIAVVGAVYCFSPNTIVRQVQSARHGRMLLHFALPIELREPFLTVKQVRSTGLGLFVLGGWFVLAAIFSM